MIFSSVSRLFWSEDSERGSRLRTRSLGVPGPDSGWPNRSQTLIPPSFSSQYHAIVTLNYPSSGNAAQLSLVHACILVTTIQIQAPHSPCCCARTSHPNLTRRRSSYLPPDLPFYTVHQSSNADKVSEYSSWSNPVQCALFQPYACSWVANGYACHIAYVLFTSPPSMSISESHVHIDPCRVAARRGSAYVLFWLLYLSIDS